MATQHRGWGPRLDQGTSPDLGPTESRLRRPDSLWELIFLTDEALPDEPGLMDAGRRLGVDLGAEHGLLLVVGDDLPPPLLPLDTVWLSVDAAPTHRLLVVPVVDRDQWLSLRRGVEARSEALGVSILAVDPLAGAPRLRAAYREAVAALPLLRRVGDGRAVHALSRLRLPLLLAGLGAEARRALYEEPLRGLLDEGAAERARDLATIRAWHACGGETKATARMLRIHPRSVLRRLALIRERIGAAPESGDVYVAALAYLLDHPELDRAPRHRWGVLSALTWLLHPRLLQRLRGVALSGSAHARQERAALAAIVMAVLVQAGAPSSPGRIGRVQSPAAPGAMGTSTAAARPEGSQAVASHPRGQGQITAVRAWGQTRSDPRTGDGRGGLPDDLRVATAVRSPDYDRDHTVVAIGSLPECLCWETFLSVDGGANWDSGDGPRSVNGGLALPPGYPDDPGMFIGSNAADIVPSYFSQGFGKQWLPLSVPHGQIVVSPRYESTQTIFIAGVDTVWSYHMPNGPLRPLLVDHAHRDLRRPVTVDVLAAGADGQDGGILVLAPPQASTLDQPGPFTSNGPPPVQIGSVFRCTDDASATCTELGQTGIDVTSGWLQLSPRYAADHTMLATNDHQSSVSTDGGRHFQVVGVPSGTNARAVALASAPNAGPVLWMTYSEMADDGRTMLGFEGGLIRLSQAPWSLVPTAPVPTIGWYGAIALALSPSRLLFLSGVGGGYLCTADAGRTWASRCPPET